MIASNQGDFLKVKGLLELQKADPNKQDKYGQTALVSVPLLPPPLSSLLYAPSSSELRCVVSEEERTVWRECRLRV